MNTILTVVGIFITITIPLTGLSYKRPDIYNDIQEKVENKLFIVGMVVYFYTFSIILLNELQYITINIVTEDTLIYLSDPMVAIVLFMAPYAISIFYLGQIKRVQKYIKTQ
jgi:hypothetical protein